MKILNLIASVVLTVSACVLVIMAVYPTDFNIFKSNWIRIPFLVCGILLSVVGVMIPNGWYDSMWFKNTKI